MAIRIEITVPIELNIDIVNIRIQIYRALSFVKYLWPLANYKIEDAFLQLVLHILKKAP